jgi:hypothetical protein
MKIGTGKSQINEILDDIQNNQDHSLWFFKRVNMPVEAVFLAIEDGVIDEEDIEDMMSNCNPCYDEGDEVGVDYGDSDGEWEITSFEQITESDYQRIKSKLLIKESDKDNSKLMKFLDIYMNEIMEDGVWYDDDHYWLINPKTKEWIFEYRKDSKNAFMLGRHFRNIQNFTGMDTEPDSVLEDMIAEWMRKKFGFYVRSTINWGSEQQSMVRDVLKANNRWEEMNQR